MCPNCVLNQSAPYAYIGPGLICLLFIIMGAFFYYISKKLSEPVHQNSSNNQQSNSNLDNKNDIDSEDAKYSVFDD